MRSINHLYNACHIKCYYDCGLESESAVLKLARFQDGHIAFGAPPPFRGHHQSIYGGHTCLLVRVWMQVWEWQLRSLMDLTCTVWVDAKDRFTRFSQWHLWSRQWAKCLTYYTDETTFCCGPDNAVKQRWIIPSNGPVESWITVTLIVLPRSLARVILQHALTQENRKPRSSLSFSWWILKWLHKTLWPTAYQTPLLSPWNAQLVCSQEHRGAEHSVPVDHLQELGVFKSGRPCLPLSQKTLFVSFLLQVGKRNGCTYNGAQIGQPTASCSWI